jgi:sodium transport system permease protein
MNHVLTIARKEIIDGLRDFRSLLAAFFYAIMGPLVVGLVSLAVSGTSTSGASVLTSMMAIFTLVSAFVGGMNVAMDTVAGERERRSLLPLLLTAVPREEIMLGKWLAVSFFALAGLLVDILGFAIVLALTGTHTPALSLPSLALLAFGLFSLPLLAAAMQLLISTASHAIKEAQTYLSLVVFAPMGIGMFMVFSPAAKHAWLGYLPIVGQQLQLEAWFNGQVFGVWQPLALGYLTLALTFLALMAATNRLRRDEILYGN